jgi:hypothetical protein
MVTSNIVSFSGISGACKSEAMAGFSARSLAMIQGWTRFFQGRRGQIERRSFLAQFSSK